MDEGLLVTIVTESFGECLLEVAVWSGTVSVAHNENLTWKALMSPLL